MRAIPDGSMLLDVADRARLSKAIGELAILAASATMHLADAADKLRSRELADVVKAHAEDARRIIDELAPFVTDRSKLPT